MAVVELVELPSARDRSDLDFWLPLFRLLDLLNPPLQLFQVDALVIFRKRPQPSRKPRVLKDGRHKMIAWSHHPDRLRNRWVREALENTSDILACPA